MRQNRVHARRQSIGRIKISWQADGRGITEWGMVQDRSTGGIGVKIPRPIEKDSVIALVQGFSTMFGVVRHCTRVNGHFFIGVEFCAVEGSSTAPTRSTVEAAGPDQRDEESVETTQESAEEVLAGEELVGVTESGSPQITAVPYQQRSSQKARRSWE